MATGKVWRESISLWTHSVAGLCVSRFWPLCFGMHVIVTCERLANCYFPIYIRSGIRSWLIMPSDTYDLSWFIQSDTYDDAGLDLRQIGQGLSYNDWSIGYRPPCYWRSGSRQGNPCLPDIVEWNRCSGWRMAFILVYLCCFQSASAPSRGHLAPPI